MTGIDTRSEIVHQRQAGPGDASVSSSNRSSPSGAVRTKIAVHGRVEARPHPEAHLVAEPQPAGVAPGRRGVARRAIVVDRCEVAR